MWLVVFFEAASQKLIQIGNRNNPEITWIILFTYPLETHIQGKNLFHPTWVWKIGSSSSEKTETYLFQHVLQVVAEIRKQQFWKNGDVFISACPSSCLLKSDPLCEVAHHYISGIWSVKKLQNRYHGVHSHAYGLHFLKRRWYTTSMETLVSGRWFQTLMTGRRRSDTAPFCWEGRPDLFSRFPWPGFSCASPTWNGRQMGT